MSISDEWSNNKLSKEATKIVLMPSLWNHVVFTLKTVPLVHVLCLVDGENKGNNNEVIRKQ